MYFSSSSQSHQSLWQPAADVYRTHTGWLVKLDVAGVRLDDIEMEITSKGVGVEGRRRDFQAVEGCRHYSMEISYNRFQRFIPLPHDLTDAAVHVRYSEGILLIELVTEGNPDE